MYPISSEAMSGGAGFMSGKQLAAQFLGKNELSKTAAVTIPASAESSDCC
jgi:hypothetical protein